MPKIVLYIVFILTAVQVFGEARNILPTTTQMIPMPGETPAVHLATDLYLPQEGSKWPVVLQRTPYNKGSDNFTSMLSDEMILDLNADGIAIVVQDVRGRFESDGEDLAFACDGWTEKQDGRHTVEWIRAQEWSNGKIVTIGASAPGTLQLLLAGSGVNNLAGQIISMAPASSYHSTHYTGGAYRKEMTEGWLNASPWNYETNIHAIRDNPLYNEWWQSLNILEPGRIENIKSPVVLYSGWYDLFTQGTLDLYKGICERGAANAEEQTYLIVGPYTHMKFNQTEQGERHFPNADYTALNIMPTNYEWITHWLLNRPLSTNPERPVLYYTMGEHSREDAPGNEWNTAVTWPPASTLKTYFLNSNGALNPNTALTEQTQAYTYSPENPVPTRGGQNFLMTPGPYDQSGMSGNPDLEDRSDVLIYTTEPQNKPIEVTGEINVRLYVSTNVPCTDFTAKLTDLYPDGRSMLIIDSIHRLGYNEDFTETAAIEAGKIYELDIALGSTSYIFNQGHRIRLAISSSNSPRFEPNPNTGDLNWENTNTLDATQTIHTGGNYPSGIILPIIESPCLNSNWYLFN